MNKIMLSYSTINDMMNCRHTWLNKVMGLKKMTNRYMTEGSSAHRIIQSHVSGKQFDERLKSITVRFPIVEEVDRDERTHFVLPINEEYSVHGYLDGLDHQNNRILEIKTSSQVWGMSKFYNLMQWRIYALAFPQMKEAWLISCTRDLKQPVMFNLPITRKHHIEALAWIKKGIDIIESGDFEPRPKDNPRYCGYIGCSYC